MSMTYSTQFSLNNLRQRLFMKGQELNQNVRTACKEAAEEIMEKSKENAPVDTHNLEEAHRVVEGVTQAGNSSFSVEVSGSGSTGRDVDDYANEMHEHLAPHGSGEYNLGPGSQAKADGGADVGGKFLERAVAEKKPEVIKKFRKIVKDTF